MSGPVSVWDVGRGGNLSQSVCHAVVETLPTVLVASAVDSSGDAIPIMHATIVCCRERSNSAWHYDMMVVHAPYLPSGIHLSLQVRIFFRCPAPLWSGHDGYVQFRRQVDCTANLVGSLEVR